MVIVVSQCVEPVQGLQRQGSCSRKVSWRLAVGVLTGEAKRC